MKRLFLQVCAHVEADGRPDAHAAYLQTDGCARPHVQWCVANCTVWTDVPADAAAHGEPDDRARPGSDLRADRRADAVALRCADQQTVLHSDGCPERTAEPAAFFEADVRTDDHTYAVSLCRANEVERAPLNIVCLVPPPYPPHPPLP